MGTIVRAIAIMFVGICVAQIVNYTFGFTVDPLLSGVSTLAWAAFDKANQK